MLIKLSKHYINEGILILVEFLNSKIFFFNVYSGKGNNWVASAF